MRTDREPNLSLSIILVQGQALTNNENWYDVNEQKWLFSLLAVWETLNRWPAVPSSPPLDVTACDVDNDFQRTQWRLPVYFMYCVYIYICVCVDRVILLLLAKTEREKESESGHSWEKHQPSRLKKKRTAKSLRPLGRLAICRWTRALKSRTAVAILYLHSAMAETHRRCIQ